MALRDKHNAGDDLSVTDIVIYSSDRMEPSEMIKILNTL